MKTKIKPELYEFLRLIEDNFDHIKDHLLSTYGDPRNDVGDAGNALELISNVITEATLGGRMHFIDEFIKCVKGPNYSDLHLVNSLIRNLEDIIIDYHDQTFDCPTPYLIIPDLEYTKLWVKLGYKHAPFSIIN